MILGTQLFSANMDAGNANQWSGNFLMSAANVIINQVSTERPQAGTHSIKTVCNMGINQLASTQYFEYEGATRNNSDAIYTCWYWANESFDMSGASWDNIMQWKTKYSTNRSYPVFTLGFNVRGGKGSGGPNYIELRHAMEWFGGTSYNVPEINQVNVPIQQWFKLQARYIQATNNTGRVIVELNDVVIYDINNVLTKPLTNSVPNGGSYVEIMWSCNNYGQGHVPASRTLFMDSASINLPVSGNPSPNAPPAGTPTITNIIPQVTTATVNFTYSLGDSTGFQYRINGGTIIANTNTSISLNGLTASTTYNIQIRATNSFGSGAWSTLSNFTTLATPPVSGNTPIVVTQGVFALTISGIAPLNSDPV
jgi:hypothetical protein